jgi:hypothetical protein
VEAEKPATPVAVVPRDLVEIPGWSTGTSAVCCSSHQVATQRIHCRFISAPSSYGFMEPLLARTVEKDAKTKRWDTFSDTHIQ